MAVKLGLDAKLYRNTATPSTPTWSEVSNVKDLTLNLEATEADVTTRGNAGWRATLAALQDASLEFDMVWDTEDEAFAAFLAAFLNRSSVELAVLDGGITATGSQGLRASFAVLNVSRNEPLEEALTAGITLKPTYSANPPTWMLIP